MAESGQGEIWHNLDELILGEELELQGTRVHYSTYCRSNANALACVGNGLTSQGDNSITGRIYTQCPDDRIRPPLGLILPFVCVQGWSMRAVQANRTGRDVALFC